MSSLKEPAAPHDEYALRDRQRRKQHTRLALLLLAPVAAIIAAALLFVWWKSNPTALLDLARAKLALAAAEKDLNVQRSHAAEAESLLNRYLLRAGKQRDSARLLVSAAIHCEAAGGIGTLERRKQADFVEERHDLSRVSTADLALAAETLATRRPDLGEPLVKEALARKENREASLRAACRVSYELGREEQALAHCRELIELAPQEPISWEIMSAIYENRDYSEQLLPIYRKRVELEPQRAQELRRQLIEHLIRVGSVAEAREELGRLQMPAGDLDLLLLEAQIQELEGDGRSAYRLAEKVLIARPGDRTALLLQGRLLLSEGKFAASIKCLEQAAAIDLLEHQTHYLLGQAYARLGNVELAEKHLARQRQLLDTGVKLNSLERRAALQPGNVAVREEIADLWQSLGNRERAEYWEAAARLAAGSSPHIGSGPVPEK